MDRIKNAIIHWLGGYTADEYRTVELQRDRLYVELDKLETLDHDTVLDIDGKQIWVKQEDAMGTLTKKLHILKTGGTEETCNIYTTPEEVGGSPYLALEVDGTKGYVKLGSTTDANATHLRVEKNGTTYAAWKEAVTYVNVTITQSANQTIHVYTPRKNGGTDHTSSFKIPKGTAYEAEVIAVGGYTAGTLNVSTWG